MKTENINRDSSAAVAYNLPTPSIYQNVGDLNGKQYIDGLVQGLWQGQQSRIDELNDRIVDRRFPVRPLQPNFSSRPVPTKYAHFPIIDRRAVPTTPIRREEMYNPATHFSPITSNGPVATYLANIDLETVLQNRHVALQHGADQGVYVPSSKSDLYGFSAVGRQEDMGDRSLIFHRHELNTKVSEVATIVGKDTFHNNTRTQLRGV
jgi:hypothetical protein